MKLDFSLAPDIGLQITSGINLSSPYPTARIQKGLVLIYQGLDLSEEAVGFGVPVIKRGLQTIFPGEVDLYLHGGSLHTRVSARYKLNLEERVASNGNHSLKNRFIYSSKNSLAAMIRHFPLMRKFLTSTSNVLRSTLALETKYETSDFSTTVVLTYTIDERARMINIELAGGDFLANSISEIIIMNEMGAHHFDQYQEVNRARQQGDEIGCWDLVHAEHAAFIDDKHRLSFGLTQVEGARLYRGRELIEPRLAWSGFGYSFPPSLKHFSCTVAIQRLP